MIPKLEQHLKQAAVITAPIAAIEMLRHFTGWPAWQHQVLAVWQLIVAAGTTFVVFYCGWPLLSKGWNSYRNRRLNMFSMIAPGILITYFYSVLATFFPKLFLESFQHQGQVPVYFEAAAVITTLVLLGQWLEGRAERRTGDALEALGKLNPSRACVIRNNQESWISIADVVTGDIIQLRAGDRIPVDGPVIKGEALVDESMLSGEPLPRQKQPGDQVTGGTLVREGALTMRADRIGEKTVLSHIIQMVRAAQESRAPIQRVADRVTGRLVPVVLLVCLFTFLGWWIWGPEPSWWYGLLHAVTVLMITCPCALGLATPMSIMTGIGRGALEGILIKDAASLEKLAQVRTIVLDKTGTLTTGRPTLHACISRNPGRENWLLKMVASVEHLSHHPLSLAIVEGARQQGIAVADVTDFKSETGGGVSGVVDGNRVLAGNEVWLAGKEISGADAMASFARELEKKGSTLIWVAINQQFAGLLAVADELKPNAREAVQILRDQKYHLVMVTGDTESSARLFAQRLGITEVISGVLPEDKAIHIERLKQGQVAVAMVGDGINDAPALATADVGIAIGTGTDVAVASGHINLLKGDIMSLVQAMGLSRQVMRNIRQNLFFAFVYNFVMIPIAAGLLYPWTGLMLTPMLASVAMSASCITVISNSLRLQRTRLI